MYQILLAFMCLILMCSNVASAKPFDEQGGKLLQEVIEELNKNDHGVLSAAVVKKLITAGHSDNRDLRLVAGFGLAYTRDVDGLATLKMLEKDKDNGVSGLAAWAVSLQTLTDKGGVGEMGELAYILAKAPNPMQRTMTVHTIGIRYKDAASQVFLLLLRDDKDPMVRLEVAAELSQSSEKAVLQEVLELTALDQIELDEGNSYFLSKVTGSTRGTIDSIRAAVKNKIQ